MKDMLASVLAVHCGGRDDVLATEGNLNNDIGVPLMLLKLREHHRYAVIELGMNHLGEIDHLSRIASPGAALVNNAHRAHIGILGSLEAIAQARRIDPTDSANIAQNAYILAFMGRPEESRALAELGG